MIGTDARHEPNPIVNAMRLGKRRPRYLARPV